MKGARRLVKAVREKGDAPEDLKNAADLLERVAEQDIEEDDQGKIRIRQGVDVAVVEVLLGTMPARDRFDQPCASR
ncbi:MAG: hypothetical protein QME87_09460 [Bacillota bacterium]|nr:hypothetical protein [Bacillota bacterium]